MTAAVSLLLLVVVIVVTLLLGMIGFWSNLITLINTVVAGLLTMNYYEFVAAYLTEMMSSMAYYADIIAFWGVFGLVFTLLRAVTDQVSSYKVRFPAPVEIAGNYLTALAIGWVALCLVVTSLHMAPLAREALFDGFKPEEPCLFGIAPDRLWLGFTQRTSQGAVRGANIFDDDGSFLIRYAARREKFNRNE